MISLQGSGAKNIMENSQGFIVEVSMPWECSVSLKSTFHLAVIVERALCNYYFRISVNHPASLAFSANDQ